MKKILLALVALMVSFTAMATEEKVIEQTALPKAAQSFIKNYYPTDKVAIATIESDLFSKEYKVVLTSGVKVEFDGKGNWTEIGSKSNSSVPKEVVNAKVAQYVKDKFPSNKIVKVERSKKTTDVELDNGIDLEFNAKGELVKFDN